MHTHTVCALTHVQTHARMHTQNQLILRFVQRLLSPTWAALGTVRKVCHMGNPLDSQLQINGHLHLDLRRSAVGKLHRQQARTKSRLSAIAGAPKYL
jgi:hypothetical protein